jgi:hypothetical protein
LHKLHFSNEGDCGRGAVGRRLPCGLARLPELRVLAADALGAGLARAGRGQGAPWREGYGPDDARLGFVAMFDALKPGGVLGIVDHRWPDSGTEDPLAANGYISEDRTIAFAEGAGFEFAGRSDINRNPRDTHNHPEGVWTLPPSLALGDQDRKRYLEIGESDRYTLKFVKPAAR